MSVLDVSVLCMCRYIVDVLLCLVTRILSTNEFGRYGISGETLDLECCQDRFCDIFTRRLTGVVGDIRLG